MTRCCYRRPLHQWISSKTITFAGMRSQKRSPRGYPTSIIRDIKTTKQQEHDMTIGPTPRVSRAWDWLTGVHSQKSAYWLILGPTIALTFLGVVMGLYAVLGLVLLIWMGKWRRQTYHKLAVIMLLVSIVLLALVFTPLGVEVNGNRNWLRLGGFSFQPAEAAKLSYSVWAAYALSQK